MELNGLYNKGEVREMLAKAMFETEQKTAMIWLKGNPRIYGEAYYFTVGIIRTVNSLPRQENNIYLTSGG
jgi:hypothetical protein